MDVESDREIHKIVLVEKQQEIRSGKNALEWRIASSGVHLMLGL
jgi:methionine-rich copper-binding protein CopC